MSFFHLRIGERLFRARTADPCQDSSKPRWPCLSPGWLKVSLIRIAGWLLVGGSSLRGSSGRQAGSIPRGDNKLEPALLCHQDLCP